MVRWGLRSVEVLGFRLFRRLGNNSERNCKQKLHEKYISTQIKSSYNLGNPDSDKRLNPMLKRHSQKQDINKPYPHQIRVILPATAGRDSDKK